MKCEWLNKVLLVIEGGCIRIKCVCFGQIGAKDNAKQYISSNDHRNV